MSDEIWVVAEQIDHQLKKVTLEMICEARKLADATGTEMAVILLGENLTSLTADLFSYGADKVIAADDPKLKNYTTGTYTRVLTDLIERDKPDTVLMGHTVIGSDLAPRVAERLKTGLVCDVTAIHNSGGQLVFERPVYAGKALAKARLIGTGPKMVTIRPNSMDVSVCRLGWSGVTVSAEVNLVSKDFRQVIKDITQKVAKGIDLTEANIVVSGGRGLQGPQGFQILEDLADVIGGAVGASRAAVDSGWRDHHSQVGQTGKVVSPTVYFACGISGAIQHFAGMSSSKIIIAINKDPEANIFKRADYGIVGDLFEVVPELTKEFKRLLAQEKAS